MSSHQNQFEHWINEPRRRLPPLRGKKPETKARQFWALWPEISVALEDRHSVKGITLWLAEHIELTLTMNTMSTYIRRCRHRDTTHREPAQWKSRLIQASAESSQASREIKPALPPLRKSLMSDSNRDKEPDIAYRPRFDIRKIHNDGDPTNLKMI